MPESQLYKTALSKAMALCSRIEYCSSDIRKKLQAWDVPSGDENKIINALIKDNFINEERYTKAFVRDKFRHNRWGRIKIAAHLKSKGLGNEIIRAALEEIDNEEYIRVIKSLITSHRKTTRSKNQYDLKGKLLRFGLSKGFESGILYELLNDLDD
jgi:regulatory protein